MNAGVGRSGYKTTCNKITPASFVFSIDSYNIVAVSSSLQGSLEVCADGAVPMSIQQVCLC